MVTGVAADPGWQRDRSMGSTRQAVDAIFLHQNPYEILLILT